MPSFFIWFCQIYFLFQVVGGIDVVRSSDKHIFGNFVIECQFEEKHKIAIFHQHNLNTPIFQMSDNFIQLKFVDQAPNNDIFETSSLLNGKQATNHLSIDEIIHSNTLWKMKGVLYHNITNLVVGFVFFIHFDPSFSQHLHMDIHVDKPYYQTTNHNIHYFVCFKYWRDINEEFYGFHRSQFVFDYNSIPWNEKNVVIFPSRSFSPNPQSQCLDIIARPVHTTNYLRSLVIKNEEMMWFDFSHKNTVELNILSFRVEAIIVYGENVLHLMRDISFLLKQKTILPSWTQKGIILNIGEMNSSTSLPNLQNFDIDIAAIFETKTTAITTKIKAMREIERSTFGSAIFTMNMETWMWKDHEFLSHLRKFSKIFVFLRHYRHMLLIETAKYGYPMFRPMSTWNSNYWNIKDQHLFGDHFMVKHVEEKNGKTSVFMPKNILWVNLWSGKIIQGRDHYEMVFSSIGEPPVFFVERSEYGRELHEYVRKEFPRNDCDCDCDCFANMT